MLQKRSRKCFDQLTHLLNILKRTRKHLADKDKDSLQSVRLLVQIERKIFKTADYVNYQNML